MVRTVVILTALLGACSGAEHYDARYPNGGGLRFEGEVVRAGEQLVSQGEWTFLYPDGELQAQGQFDAGGVPTEEHLLDDRTIVPADGRDDWWSFWDAEGRLAAEGEYVEAHREDLWVTWYENGRQCCSGKFHTGLEHGYHVHWDAEGRKRDTRTYVEGRLSGERQVLDESGAALWSGLYEDGELISSEPEGVPPPPVHGLLECLRGAEVGMLTPLDSFPASILDQLRQ